VGQDEVEVVKAADVSVVVLVPGMGDDIQAIKAGLMEIGDIFVVAPESEQSGASHSLTLARPLRIRQIDGRHWTVDGTPTDCVTLALNQILSADERPHICVSGINHGPNLGDDATYSGTVAGALNCALHPGHRAQTNAGFHWR